MGDLPSNAQPLSSGQEYLTLLAVSEAIVSHRDLPTLFHDLAGRLHQVVRFDYLSLYLHDAASNTVRTHVLETAEPTPISFLPPVPVEDEPTGWVLETQQPLIVSRLAEETRWPRFLERAKPFCVSSYCALPLTTARRRMGILVFASKQEAAYDTADVEFLRQVANQVAVAVENAWNFEATQRAEAELRCKNDRLELLLDLTNRMVSNLELRDLLRCISASVRPVMQCDLVGVLLPDSDSRRLQLHAFDFPGSKGFIHEKDLVAIDGALSGRVFRTRQPWAGFIRDLPQVGLPQSDTAVAEGVKTICVLPLVYRDHVLGVLVLARRAETAFSPDDLEFLARIADQVAMAVENALAYGQIAALKDKLAQEKVYLEEEIRTGHHFEDIVGESIALRRVLKEVESVAPTHATVLIRGETGTGKELIARALHDLSPRRDRTFVKLNCAAIPTGLLESELFGHEKGAFTGAISQKVGRFELAHQGTLFLDEVGDIPPELQPKLLRALQEQEFERLGSTRTIRVDVRLVAATNRDLAQMVALGTFRSDLYYRFNVFPVVLPPLRDRRDDIPRLVRHFTQQFARRMGRRIEAIPAEAMAALTNYAWPGNIREMQNVIERAVILSPGKSLLISLGDLPAAAPETPVPGGAPVTLADAEREHILGALHETDWVLGGPKGAAARLGMARSTLHWKMKKLGLSRPQ
jgi:formate hydrogenlyase transcriptional activator